MPYNFDEIVPRENTDCLKYDGRVMRFGTNDVQPMWVADMDFRVPDFITKTFTDLVNHGIYGYHLKTDRYYSAIINWFKRRYNYKIDAKEIFFTPGTVASLSYMVQALTDIGDKIIVQSPVYYPFFSVILQNNRQIIFNQLVENKNNYTIDFEDFEEKAKDAKMFIFCHPHNPVGRDWQKSELEKLAKICLQNRVIVVSDEVHNDLVYSPFKHIPFASLSPEIDEITITCHSASKSFNLTGLSTAYVIIKNTQMQKMFKQFIKHIEVEALNTFGLTAMVSAFEQGDLWVNELLNYLSNNYNFVKDFFSKHLPQLKISPLEATFLLWIDFRKLQFTDKELKDLIIHKAHIGLNDGTTFGPGGSGFQRMNIGCPLKVIQSALEKLKTALDSIS